MLQFVLGFFIGAFVSLMLFALLNVGDRNGPSTPPTGPKRNEGESNHE